LIGRKRVNLIVGWCGRFLFFVGPCKFSLDAGEWPENQILIPDWTNFHCPGATYHPKFLIGLIFIFKEGCAQEEEAMGQMLSASLFQTGYARECSSNKATVKSTKTTAPHVSSQA